MQESNDEKSSDIVSNNNSGNKNSEISSRQMRESEISLNPEYFEKELYNIITHKELECPDLPKKLFEKASSKSIPVRSSLEKNQLKDKTRFSRHQTQDYDKLVSKNIHRKRNSCSIGQ